MRHVDSMGIEEVVTAPGSPWQSPYCERQMGSISMECLAHVIVRNQLHLLRVLRGYASYDHASPASLGAIQILVVERSSSNE